jgi:hypothetical protein
MSGQSGGPEVLRIVVFGPVAALAAYLAFRPPVVVDRLLATHAAVRVVATILCAAVVAYGCRRVVQALLRLVGFR